MTLKVRDLSESLGKLPPQSLEIEETVLGGILSDKDAISKVSSFLRATQFYSEQHSIIYSAVLSMYSNSEPIDMRTVVMHLKKAGKLELVGGAYYIAELTGKLSSSANIEAHARILVELATKRDMIHIASKIHSDAYEDTSDFAELLQRSIDDLTYLQDKTTRTSPEIRIKSLWPSILIDKKPDEIPPLLRIGPTVVATPGNHSLLVGRKKSRKSLAVALFIDMVFKQNAIRPEEIALFDTEQGAFRAWKYMDRIRRLTKQKINVFDLRGKSFTERKEIIGETIKHWPTKLRFVVIDGIRDTVADINDAVECTEIVTWLEHLTASTNIHIMNILHLNKTDGNARGHLGSELLNKAEVTIEMELDEKAGCTLVKCESARDKPFETFAFTHSEDDLPVIVNTPIKGVVINEEDRRTRLCNMFDGRDDGVKHSELLILMKEYFDLGSSAAVKVIRQFRDLGYIAKMGKDRDPNTVYKLMIDKADVTHIENKNPEPPPLFVDDILPF